LRRAVRTQLVDDLLQDVRFLNARSVLIGFCFTTDLSFMNSNC
jgi:hypothetical protein